MIWKWQRMMSGISPSNDPFDEFSFVAQDAARLGLTAPLPNVRRAPVTAENGERLSALVWGDTAPDVVFLHGGGLNAHSWDSTTLALGSPAVAIDLPGHGDSDWRDNFDYAPQSIAEPLASVIDQLCARPRALVGQSLGGLAAVAVAALLGERVSRLVLVDITPGRRTSEPSSRVVEFIAGPKSYASRAEVIDRALQFGMGTSRDALERGVLLNTRIRHDGRVVFKHHLASPPAGAFVPYAGEALWPILENLEIPVLLVYGTTGILDTDQVDEFATRIPLSTTISLEAGHNVQRDAPIELAETINNFIH